VKIVGIDPGTHTGVAVWDTSGRFLSIQSMAVHRALELLTVDRPDAVIFEDARKRGWFGKMDEEERKYGHAVREGAGAAKRDATIWEDFLEDRGYPYLPRKPSAGGSKWDAATFRNVTKWQERTNEHSRDAGVLVFGFRDLDVAGVVRSWEQLRANKTPTASARR
jgi:hypothetical protein